MRLDDKTIKLWDSCVYDKINGVFMQLVCSYLYDIHTHKQQHNQWALEEWRLAWACSNQSINSLIQDNNKDCGIFTVVSLALAAAPDSNETRTPKT